MSNIQPTLAQIAIYPVKSLDGMVVERTQISAGGALEYDRRWAIVDERGKVVNAKRTVKIQQLRSQFNLVDRDRPMISLATAADPTIYTFCLTTEPIALARWLSQFFGFAVSLIENATHGFPDDPDAYGPTIISTATLKMVCGWFPGLDLDEARRRFRTNLEVSGVPAFWEDRLFGAPGAVVKFRVGEVEFEGINPCQRCIVPTRDSLSGAVSAKFQQIFSQQRQQTLPAEIHAARFNHFYRLALNTRIPRSEAGKLLMIGDVAIVY
ncbi:MOSC domain-containing protein [Chamaesiphon sp.]|uniref:MOSC domain-containing protein n=1 Tax=Chamaesiphon sp. TaxID=2814140 RepID=UPI0035945522